MSNPRVVCAAVAILALASAAQAINCNTTVVLNNTQTLSENYEKTAQTVDPCIRLEGGTAQVVNLGGVTLTCNSPTGLCGRAIQISTGGTVKNGNVKSGTGVWESGVNCFSDSSGTYIDCDVSNMYIEAFGVGVDGGKKIDQTVVLGADRCIDSKKVLSSGGFYRQNYCATENGIRLKGPTSGTFTVERNFIRASTGTGIEVQSGNATLEHNIIDAATPIDDTNGGTVSLSENICSNATDCPDPTQRGFSLTVNFD